MQNDHRPIRARLTLLASALALCAVAPLAGAQAPRGEEEYHDRAEWFEGDGIRWDDEWGYDRLDDDHDYDFDQGGWYESDLAWAAEQEWYEFGEGWDDYNLDYYDYGEDWYETDDEWLEYYDEALDDTFGETRAGPLDAGWRDDDDPLGWHQEWDATEGEYEWTFGSYRVAPTVREEPRHGWHFEWDPAEERWTRELGWFDEYWEDDSAVMWRSSPEELR